MNMAGGTGAAAAYSVAGLVAGHAIVPVARAPRGSKGDPTAVRARSLPDRGGTFTPARLPFGIAFSAAITAETAPTGGS